MVIADFSPVLAGCPNPASAGAARLFGVLVCPASDTGTALPNAARYQLRYTPIVIKLWSCKWSNLWSNTFLTAIFCFPYRPKIARLKGFLRFSLSCGAKTAYAPKPPALPTALHPVVKFLPIQTAYVSGLTFILTYILYINTAESAIFFSARLPHCAAISLSGTALLHISATRYIFNSLNAAKIAVAWYSCM